MIVAIFCVAWGAIFLAANTALGYYRWRLCDPIWKHVVGGAAAIVCIGSGVAIAGLS